MKLGTQTNSLTNHILSRAVKGQPTPEVGMGVTILAWTDRYAATITEVKTVRGRLVLTVQRDRAVRTDRNGFSEDQTWVYQRNTHGRIQTFRQRHNGMWQEVTVNSKTGRLIAVEGNGLRIGERQEYCDPTF